MFGESSLDLFYLDFSKAFDKVDHGVLLYKRNSQKFKYLSYSTNVSITSDYVNAYVSPNFYVIDNVNNHGYNHVFKLFL